MKYTKDRKFIGNMFDEISPTYDRLNHLLSGWQDNRWRKSAISHLGGPGSNYTNILDLASGSGDLGAEFLKLNPEKLYSADISFEMLRINRKKLAADVNHTIRAEAEHLPFAADFFDLCGIAFGVRNFENLENCLKEIHRVLKRGGKFLTIEMFKPEKATLINRSFRLYFEKILPKLGNRLSKSNYAYNYLFESVDNFRTVNNYSELLKESGFEVKLLKNNFLGIVYSVFAEKL